MSQMFSMTQTLKMVIELAQWLKAIGALTGDTGLVPGPTWWLITSLIPVEGIQCSP